MVLHFSGVAGVWTLDTASYIAPIHGLMHGSFVTHDGPEFLRTPGYPIFLMLTGMASNHPLWCIYCQIGVACFSVFLLFKLGMLIFRSESTAILCAFLYALEPIAIIYSVELFSEALFTAFFIGFLYALIHYMKSHKWSSLLWAAVILSASAYVRPVSYYLAPFCAAGLAVFPRGFQLVPRFARAAAFLGICAVLIGLWQVRNYKEIGYSGFTSLSESNLYFYNALGVVAKKTHTSLFVLQQELGREPLTPSKLLSLRTEGIQIVKNNPVLYTWLHLEGMAIVLWDPCATDMLKQMGLYPKSGRLMSIVVERGIPAALLWLAKNRPLPFVVTMILGAVVVAYYALALLGAPLVLKQTDVFITLLFIFTYFIVISGGAAAAGRYRYPVVPIVVLFAGAGLGRLLGPDRSIFKESGNSFDFFLAQNNDQQPRCRESAI
jgi:hypothetical protein